MMFSHGMQHLKPLRPCRSRASARRLRFESLEQRAMLAIAELIPPQTLVTEQAQTIVVAVSLDSPAPVDTIFNVAISGLATNGSDYTAASVVVVPMGQVNGGLSVAIAADAIEEVDESISISLLPAGGYTVGPRSSVTLTIVDDDGASIVNRGNVIRVRMDGPSEDVRVTFNSTSSVRVFLNGSAQDFTVVNPIVQVHELDVNTTSNQLVVILPTDASLTSINTGGVLNTSVAVAGEGYRLDAINVRRSFLFGGIAHEALINGNNTENTFYGLAQYSLLYDELDNFHEVVGFGRVTAVAGYKSPFPVDDIAVLFGSSGPDLFLETKGTRVLTGEGYSIVTTLFQQNFVFGQGGLDTAQISEAKMVISGETSWSIDFSPAPNPLNFRPVSFGYDFEDVSASLFSIFDLSIVILGSPETDTIEWKWTDVTLVGPSRRISVAGPQLLGVIVVGGGGNDLASISLGRDDNPLYPTVETVSALVDAGTTLLSSQISQNLLVLFDVPQISVHEAGLVNIYGSVGNDRVVIDDDGGKFQSGQYSVEFESVQTTAIVGNGGIDSAQLSLSGGLPTVASDFFQMPFVTGFDFNIVDVLFSPLKSGSVTLFDSLGDDVLSAMTNRVELAYSGGRRASIVGARSVVAISQQGNDRTAIVQPVDVALVLNGNWISS